MKLKFFAAIFLGSILFQSHFSWAQTAASSKGTHLTLEQVVHELISRNAARAAALKTMQSRRTYTLTYKGFPGDLHASMVADMNYTAPSTKTFTVVSQTGQKLLVDQVLKRLMKAEEEAQEPANQKRVELNDQNYDFSDLQYQPAADGCSYNVALTPKSPNKYLYRGRIWINDKDFAVCRIEAQPAKNPSFWVKSTEIHHTYGKFGEFWLPVKNVSESNTRFNGHAVLTIEYGDYRINGATTTATPGP